MGASSTVPQKVLDAEIDSLFHDDNDENDSEHIKTQQPSTNKLTRTSIFSSSIFSQVKEEEKESIDITQFINLIHYNDFSQLGYIPRNPDCKHLLTTLDKVHRETSFIVYVSHAWIRTDSSVRGWEGSPHPDYQFNYKFKLIVDGIDKARKLFASGMRECYIWIDYTCLNQDTLYEDIEPNIILFDKILMYADCIFTPVYIENRPGKAAQVETLHNSINNEIHHDLTNINNIAVPDYYSAYPHAPNWNDMNNTKAYLNRAWCRLELLYSAVLPLLEDNGDGVVKRRTKFINTFRSHYNNLHRPHILYTTYDSKHKLQPIVMPMIPLTELFTRYRPMKGSYTNPQDYEIIKRLNTALKPLMKSALIIKNTVPDTVKQLGNGEIYSGPIVTTTNDTVIQKHGSGMHKTTENIVYKGTYENDQKSGYGIEKTPTGIQYFGEYKDNMRHGHGLLKFPNGDTFEGAFQHGVKCGQGVFKFYNGDVHTGSYANDVRNGYGECIFMNGDSYYGMYKDDVYDGQGTYNYKDGHMYKGTWCKGLYIL